MPQLNYVPVHFTLFLILGIILGNVFDYSVWTLVFAAIFLFIGLVFSFFRAEKSFRFPFGFFLFSATLFVCIGMLSMELTKPKNQKKHYSHFLNANNTSSLRIHKILKPNDYYFKMEAEVLQLNKNKTQGKILVQLERKNLPKELSVDAIIFTTNQFSEVRKAMNPFEFDYNDYLKKQDIHHQIVLKNDTYTLLSKQSKTLYGFAHNLREKINNRLKEQDFSKDELSIFNAILLGQRQDLSKETFEIYKNAGAIHILAVSGLHIGIILLLLNFLLQPLERGKHGKIIKLVLVVLFLWFYAFLAGLSASVIRAVTMFTAIAIGITLNRPSGVKNSLVVSLFFLLLLHPLFLFDVGFQLSYTAVFSIVWLQPFFSNLWKPKHKITHYFWQLLTVSFAAQLGILPLSLFYFHQFPGLFFISSLVIIPFLGFILGFGFLVAILALTDGLPQFLVDFYEIFLASMNTFVAFISAQESFIFKNISFSIVLLISSYALLIFTINLLKYRNTKNVSLFLMAVLCIQLTFFYEKKKKHDKSEFIVFQETASTIFLHRKREKVLIYDNVSTKKNPFSRPLQAYVLGNNNLEIAEIQPIKNYYHLKNSSILVVDSLAIFMPLQIHPETVILTQSPKINLQRMLEILQPKTIVADGSNYRSYVNRWQKTCEKQKINFHDTSKKGAFVIDY